MNTPRPALQLQEISRVFARGRIRAVDGVSLEVFPGEIVSILGPSGCGKTTTMRMIAGLDAPTSGDIRIFGESVRGKPPHRRNVGLVFQSLAIFPHMTVRQNVAFGLRMRGLGKEAIAEKVARVLALVQLPAEDFAERYPNALSGGQLQRVALARTLVTEPALVLFDEPMAALDRRLRDYMAIELRAIQKALGIAAIYVTHDQETASAMSDRIAIMQAGRIVQVGSPAEVYESPASRFVAEFLGDANILVPTSVGERNGLYRTVEIADAIVTVLDTDHDAAGTAVLMFRPEHAEIRSEPAEGSRMQGVVVASQFKAGSYCCQVRLPDGQLVVARSAEDPFRNGPRDGAVWLAVKAANVRLLRQ
jgi:ABC-type Fe3+/spermidine/putrescine transport system ATPase subunit